MGCVHSLFNPTKSRPSSPENEFVPPTFETVVVRQPKKSKTNDDEADDDDNIVSKCDDFEKYASEENDDNHSIHYVEATAIRTLAANTGSVAILGTTAKCKSVDNSPAVHQPIIERQKTWSPSSSPSLKTFPQIETRYVEATAVRTLAAETGSIAILGTTADPKPQSQTKIEQKDETGSIHYVEATAVRHLAAETGSIAILASTANVVRKKLNDDIDDSDHIPLGVREVLDSEADQLQQPEEIIQDPQIPLPVVYAMENMEPNVQDPVKIIKTTSPSSSFEKQSFPQRSITTDSVITEDLVGNSSLSRKTLIRQSNEQQEIENDSSSNIPILKVPVFAKCAPIKSNSMPSRYFESDVSTEILKCNEQHGVLRGSSLPNDTKVEIVDQLFNTTEHKIEKETNDLTTIISKIEHEKVVENIDEIVSGDVNKLHLGISVDSNPAEKLLSVIENPGACNEEDILKEEVNTNNKMFDKMTNDKECSVTDCYQTDTKKMVIRSDIKTSSTDNVETPFPDAGKTPVLDDVDIPIPDFGKTLVLVSGISTQENRKEPAPVDVQTQMLDVVKSPVLDDSKTPLLDSETISSLDAVITPFPDTDNTHESELVELPTPDSGKASILDAVITTPEDGRLASLPDLGLISLETDGKLVSDPSIEIADDVSTAEADAAAAAEYRLTMIQSVREAVNRICEQAVEQTAAIVRSGRGRSFLVVAPSGFGDKRDVDDSEAADYASSEFSLPPLPPTSSRPSLQHNQSADTASMGQESSYWPPPPHSDTEEEERTIAPGFSFDLPDPPTEMDQMDSETDKLDISDEEMIATGLPSNNENDGKMDTKIGKDDNNVMKSVAVNDGTTVAGGGTTEESGTGAAEDPGTSGAATNSDGADDRAATTIQAVFRGFRARKYAETVNAAAVKIQAGFRGYRVRRSLKNAEPSATASPRAVVAEDNRGWSDDEDDEDDEDEEDDEKSVVSVTYAPLKEYDRGEGRAPVGFGPGADHLQTGDDEVFASKDGIGETIIGSALDRNKSGTNQRQGGGDDGDEEALTNAAVKIQAIVRGLVTRKRLNEAKNNADKQ